MKGSMTEFSQHNNDELLARAFRDNDAPAAPEATPTTGDLDLAERNAFRRVTRETTIRAEDTTDGYEVEYRKLRLERVILVGVWTEGTVAESGNFGFLAGWTRRYNGGHER